METIQTTIQVAQPERKTIHFTTTMPGTNKDMTGIRMSRDEVVSGFVFGNELADRDELLVNGRNVLEELPRPDQFGNNRLALLAILDALSPLTELVLTTNEIDAPLLVAD